MLITHRERLDMRKRRKQLIVNPRVQYKLLFLILVSVIIPTFLTFMSLYFLIQSIIIEAQIESEVVYSALLFMSNKVFAILFVGFIFITVLLLTWSLIFIHRIVGPIYRLERELEKVIDGKKVTKIRFRKNDSFASLADKINTLITRLQSQEK